jgi:hypothetical protein
VGRRRAIRDAIAPRRARARPGRSTAFAHRFGTRESLAIVRRYAEVRASVIASALLVVACRPTAERPPREVALVALGDAAPPRAEEPPESPAPPRPTRASVAFVERGPGVLEWDFDIRGLPATDPRSGAILVADLSHGNIASSLSLSIHWLRAGQERPARTVTVLDAGDASHVVYDIDDARVPAETAKLAAGVRSRTLDANRALAASDLRAMVRCQLRAPEGGVGCVHPQRLTCGDLEADLRGDVLSWRRGGEAGSTDPGWRIPPMTIGSGPPKEMVTCIQEAHLDPATLRIAARIEQSCEGGGSDACFLPDAWRAVSLR